MKNMRYKAPEGYEGLGIGRFPLPVILVREDYTIVSANPKAEEVFGVIKVDNDINTVIDNKALFRVIKKVIRDEKERECEITYESRRRRTFLASITPITNMDGEHAAFIAFYETTVASEAERMRAAFVADVSHELRSPLTTLIAALETLKSGAAQDPTSRERFVELMTHEATRMHRIVNDLLALSTAEAQEHILPEDRVNIREILSDISSVLSDKASGKGMTLNVDLPNNLADAQGHRDELYRVFNNLMDNAVKYGPSDSEVLIEAQNLEETVEVSVRNWGDVIPEKHLTRLTERFYRADKSRSRDMGGTGLGLAIVKHIVNRHAGDLLITSSEEDGTRFTVRILKKS